MGIICVIYSQLCPLHSPRVLSISGGAGQPVFPRGGVGRGKHPCSVYVATWCTRLPLFLTKLNFICLGGKTSISEGYDKNQECFRRKIHAKLTVKNSGYSLLYFHVGTTTDNILDGEDYFLCFLQRCCPFGNLYGYENNPTEPTFNLGNYHWVNLVQMLVV